LHRQQRAVGARGSNPAQGWRGPLQRVFGGQSPKGKINPFALKVLGAYGYSTDGYRSKGWEEFAAPGAPVMDFVFSLRQRRR